MPIEFRCPGCSKLLRVPDDSAGKKTKCPHCETISLAPHPTDVEKPTDFAAGAASENPYSSPIAEPSPKPPHGSDLGGATPHEADLGQVMQYGWDIWKEHVWLLLAVSLVVVGLNIGLSILQQVIVIATQEDRDLALAGALGSNCLGLVSSVVQIYLGIGKAMILLKLCRRQPAEFGDLFAGGSLFWPVLGASILFGIAFTVGFLMCCVPGIILAILLWSFHYLIIDRKATLLGSFETAYEIGKVNWGTTILLAFVSVGITLLGALACGVGIFVADGLIGCMWCSAYLFMAGQLGPAPAVSK